jgi:hypothetical protein
LAGASEYPIARLKDSPFASKLDLKLLFERVRVSCDDRLLGKGSGREQANYEEKNYFSHSCLIPSEIQK